MCGTPGPEEWVKALEKILMEDYLPVMVEAVYRRVFDMCLTPLKNHATEEARAEVRRLITQDVLHRVKVTIEPHEL